MAFYILLLAAFATVQADSEDLQALNAQQARQFAYSSQYPVDLQYDFSLLDPQLQYPPFAGESQNRLQPQVFLYPGSAPGQPFLLQPGAPPGNFLIPQPQPGFVLRDQPVRPPVFMSGYPKPAYTPPINKDAEEIPTNPGSLQPMPPTGQKPEKLETFDENTDVQQPTAGEADVLATPDHTFGRNPSLKPGHRFFILNGQPLFSNYPLTPQFGELPYQPASDKFGPENTQFYTYRQNGPSFLPDGFGKTHMNDSPYKVPVGNFFVRNSVTGQINSAKEADSENHHNEIGQPHNIVTFNQRDAAIPDILFKTFGDSLQISKNVDTNRHPAYHLKSTEVSDDENSRKDKESITINAAVDSLDSSRLEEPSPTNKSKQPSIARSQPSALALAGPGGVAAAAPRATALTGDKGVSVSSPQATAIAGPSKDQVKEKPIQINKKEKQ